MNTSIQSTQSSGGRLRAHGVEPGFRIQRSMPKVSVIVTVYGVEKYIERCCISIFEQTYRNFELIFVNDCSKDKSEAILLDVVHRYGHVGVSTRVIGHEVNKGVSATRETGLNAATGEYVLYVDSDDYIAPDMLELLVNRANMGDADIVYCDYVEVRNGCQLHVDQSLQFSDPRSIAAAMLRQEIVWAPWNKLFRRSLAVEHDIHWPTGINIGEDLVVITKLFCHARKVEHVSKPLYFYNRDNVNSYVNQWNLSSCYQNTRAVESVSRYLTQDLGDSNLLDAVTQIKLMARYQMLYTRDDKLWELAADTFPETNAKVFSYERASIFWRIALYVVANRKRTLSRLLLKAVPKKGHFRAL